jgi:hypothetical protein
LWGHAKDAIKEKKPNAFADIDADTLKLWKVRHCAISRVIAQLPIPKVTIDRSRRLQLESKDFLKNVTATALDSIAPLSTGLNDPIPDDHINIIIVERPTRKLLKMSWLRRAHAFLLLVQSLYQNFPDGLTIVSFVFILNCPLST